MPEIPLLLPPQKALVIDLVEADAGLPPEKRTHFVAYHWQGDDQETALIAHPGLRGGNRNVFLGDLAESGVPWLPIWRCRYGSAAA